MKICVTSEGNDLNSKVDPRFGRCRYFIIVDTATSEFEAVRNSNIDSIGGAGIQSAQLVASRQAKAVLAGNVGPDAFQTLRAAGIEVFAGASGTIQEAIDKYKKGELNSISSPSADPKAGMPGKNKR